MSEVLQEGKFFHQKARQKGAKAKLRLSIFVLVPDPVRLFPFPPSSLSSSTLRVPDPSECLRALPDVDARDTCHSRPRFGSLEPNFGGLLGFFAAEIYLKALYYHESVVP